MRTIKFRGKDIQTGKWVYGSLFTGVRLGNTRPYSVIFTDVRYENNQDELPKDIVIGFYVDEVTIVTSDSIGQFTGLTDKNCNEIYEGDILCWSDDKDRTFPMVVEYRHGAFGIVFTRNYFKSVADNPNFTFNPLDTDVDVEIIGNIHDNIELLTKKVI